MAKVVRTAVGVGGGQESAEEAEPSVEGRGAVAIVESAAARSPARSMWRISTAGGEAGLERERRRERWRSCGRGGSGIGSARMACWDWERDGKLLSTRNGMCHPQQIHYALRLVRLIVPFLQNWNIIEINLNSRKCFVSLRNTGETYVKLCETYFE
jgi:hypothetical protein